MLAFARMTYFHEEQRFRNSFLWAIVAIPIVVVLVLAATVPQRQIAGTLIGIGVGALVAALFAFARLETTVTADRIVVAFHDLWPTRRIALADIASFEPMRYTMWDSGGWGVHLGLAGMTYNVSGNDGVHLRLKSGGQVLVGTQRPAELAAAIARAMAAR